jgi:hypothetical protein
MLHKLPLLTGNRDTAILRHGFVYLAYVRSLMGGGAEGTL